MSHYKLIRTDDILGGPVDYSAPVGNTAVFLCSATCADHIERRKPVAKSFTASAGRNEFWLAKFEICTDGYPDFVEYAKGKSGRWYAQAVYL